MKKLAMDVESESSCRELARQFAPCLNAGHVLLLSGPLGAGKSVFCRELIQSRQALDGLPVEDVPSPAFTLVQTYEIASCSLLHADFYRVDCASELVELGLEDAFRTSVCLIEWPEILGDLYGRGGLSLKFTVTGDCSRRVSLEWCDSCWDGILDRVVCRRWHERRHELARA